MAPLELIKQARLANSKVSATRFECAMSKRSLPNVATNQCFGSCLHTHSLARIARICYEALQD